MTCLLHFFSDGLFGHYDLLITNDFGGDGR